MDMHELKPCPFCGGGATIRMVSRGYSPGGCFNAKYEIGCSKCDICPECKAKLKEKGHADSNNS